jgi:hypothetical protein
VVGRSLLVTQYGGVTQRYDILHVLRAPARLGDRLVTLSEPLVDLEVLALQVTPPFVLILEEVRVYFLQPFLHLLGINVQVLAPVVGQIVEALLQATPALLEEGHHEAVFVDPPTP